MLLLVHSDVHNPPARQAAGIAQGARTRNSPEHSPSIIESKRPVMRLITLFWSEPVHYIMQTRQFARRRRTGRRDPARGARQACGRREA
jgi:hypothetical protein